MAEFAGRDCVMSIGGEIIATLTTKTLTINNSAMDITSDGDAGIQRVLAKPGKKNIDISADGFADDESTLMEFALGDSLIDAVELDYGTFTLSGNFFQSSYSEGLPTAEGATFSISLMSSGVIAKTATP